MNYRIENVLQDHGLTIGRMLVGLLFAFSALSIALSGIDSLTNLLNERSIPLATLVAWIVVLFEFGSGLALILGYRTRDAALALLIFTGLVTLLFHLNMEDSHLFKNLAIMGGLLYIYVYGAGYGWSLDRQRIA